MYKLRVQRIVHFTALVLEQSFLNHLSVENSAFAHSGAAVANHYNVAFSIHQVHVSITAGYAEAVWNEKFARHLYT